VAEIDELLDDAALMPFEHQEHVVSVLGQHRWDVRSSRPGSRSLGTGHSSAPRFRQDIVIRTQGRHPLSLLVFKIIIAPSRQYRPERFSHVCSFHCTVFANVELSITQAWTTARFPGVNTISLNGAEAIDQNRP
jgi:hypothetical protein